MTKEELKKEAQAKLAQAHKLIDEAGDLAKEGQFHLHFGEIGDFIPRSHLDRDLLKEEALGILKKEGRYNGYDKVVNAEQTAKLGYQVYDYVDRPTTPFDELNANEVEDALEKIVDELLENSEVPYEFREYYTAEDADCWWHPSRC